MKGVLGETGELLPWRSEEAVDKVLGVKRQEVNHAIDWSKCPLALRYPDIEAFNERLWERRQELVEAQKALAASSHKTVRR